MITKEDISSLNDNEIDNVKLLKIKDISKKDMKLFKKIRLIKKISYLTRNTMEMYKNRLTFDVTGEVIKKLFPLN